MNEVHYKATETAARFHSDDSFVRVLKGYYGCGKTVAALLDLVVIHGVNSDPYHDSAHLVSSICPQNSLDTLLQWFPGHMVKVQKEPCLRADISCTVGDTGRKAKTKVLFIGHDDYRLFSLIELTGAFIDQADECPKEAISSVLHRVGRYPYRSSGGPSWSGVVLAGKQGCWSNQVPEGASVHRYPPAVLIGKDGIPFANPNAENTKNLPEDYYDRLAKFF